MEFVPSPFSLILAFVLTLLLGSPLPLTLKLAGIIYLLAILILFAPVNVPL